MKSNLFFVDMIDKYPQLSGILRNQSQNIFLFAYDFISSSNNGHLSDVCRVHAQIMFKIELKLFDCAHISFMIKDPFLQTGQYPKRFIGHVVIKKFAILLFSLENGT